MTAFDRRSRLFSAFSVASLAVGCGCSSPPPLVARTKEDCDATAPAAEAEPSGQEGTLFGRPFHAQSAIAQENDILPNPPNTVGVAILDGIQTCTVRRWLCAANIHVLVPWKTGARATSLSAFDKGKSSGWELAREAGTAEATMLFAEGRTGRLRVRVDDPKWGAFFEGEVDVVRCK